VQAGAKNLTPFPLEVKTKPRDMNEGGRDMKLKPLRDRVIIRRIEEEEVAEGGIVIPDTAREKPIKGEIVAVGPGRKDDDGKIIPMNVKKGDTVVFRKYAGNEIVIDDEELLIVEEDDILAILEK